MSAEMYVQRNNAMVFAQNTLDNLQMIESAFPVDSEFHRVTQFINSLLGLIVFTHEEYFVNYVAKKPLGELQEHGWPKIAIDMDESKHPTKTLGDLIRHLRNAIAHGRIKFSSDSHDLDEVAVYAEDCYQKQSEPCWIASMTASQLRELCLKLVALLIDVTA